MDPLAGAASVEAVQANVETRSVVDAVETQRAIRAVDGIAWTRRREVRVDVFAGGHGEKSGRGMC